MLAPIVAQHQPLIRDYITESPVVCIADGNYNGVGGHPSGGDPFWSNVVLLMRLDGTNGSTSAPDTSSYAHTTTWQSGGLSNNRSPFGVCSAAAPSCWNVPNNAAFDWGTGDYTIECVVWIPSGSVGGSFFWIPLVSGGAVRLGSDFSFGSLTIECPGISGTVGGNGSVPRDQWLFVVLTRSSGRHCAWVNGVLFHSSEANSGTAVACTSAGIGIGGQNGTTNRLGAGNLAEVRMTKGVARYTVTSPPPSFAALTAYRQGSIPAKTEMTLHFNGSNGASSTTDSSINARAVTTSAPAVLSTAQRKFGSASGAPGAGGYWSVPASASLELGLVDFTLEAWIYANAFSSVPGQNDPFYSKVIYLLRGDGTNGSTAIVDSSDYSHSVTRFGDTQISTAQSRSGGSSIRFDGSGDYLRPPTTMANYGTNVTFDVWVRFDSIGANRTIWSDSNTGLACYLHSGGTFRLYRSGDQIIGSTVAVANTWYHVAVTRDSSNNFRLHINGVVEGGTHNYPAGGSFQSFYIGANSGSSEFMNGYMEDFRITQATRYSTSNFTPESSIRGPADGVTPIAGSAIRKPGSWLLAACAEETANPRKLQLLVGGNSALLADTAIPLGQWTHVVLQRSAGTTRIYQDGQQVASTLSTLPLVGGFGVAVGGTPLLGGASIDGYIDEVRLTRGAALYAGNFTPSSVANCDGLTGTSDPVPAPDDTPVPSGLRFQTVTVPCLEGTQGAALSSTVIVNFDTDSNSPEARYSGLPAGLTPTLTWIGPTAGTLALAGTPASAGSYRFTATFFENNSNKQLGSAECDITIWPSGGLFTVGAMSSPTGRVGLPMDAQLTAPSANYEVDVSAVASLSIPGLSLVPAWTVGPTSSGTFKLVGTPTAAGTYPLTITYRRRSTCEIATLATSTHSIVIAALTPPPPPAPAPSPPPSPPPAPAPVPPGISAGPVPDNLWSSVTVLQQFNRIRSISYELGDSRVDSSTLYMDATGTMEVAEFGGYGYSPEGAGDDGSFGGGASVVAYAGGSRWATDGNFTVECFYRMSSADIGWLFNASSDSTYIQLMSLTVTGGAKVWSLGISSILVDGRRVVRPAFVLGRTGGPSGSAPIICFGAEMAPPAFAFFHFAGQRVRSGATDEIACWFNGVGGAPTKVVTSGNALQIGAGNTFASHESYAPNCTATGGPSFNSGRIGTGLIDQMRVTKAQRYTATAGVTNPISRDKITPPFSTS